MVGKSPNAFSLDVETSLLTRALKHLHRAEPRGKLFYLRYNSGTLTISVGKTSRDLPAAGNWQEPVCVVRLWAETLAKLPPAGAITTLRVAEGKLSAREFVVGCSLGPGPDEQADEAAKRTEAEGAAFRALAEFNVSRRDIRALVNHGDPAKARLWSPSDGPLIQAVERVWRRMVFYGVEPSDIRRLMNQKSRDLWKNASRPGGRAIGDLSEQELERLIEGADPVKAALWSPTDLPLVRVIAIAWKQLVFYGVEPSDIRRLLKAKNR